MRTRLTETDSPDVVDAGQVGQVAIATSAATLAGRPIMVSTQADVAQALDLLTAGVPVSTAAAL